jgi:hypothetical protein
MANKWIAELPKLRGKWDLSKDEHTELANLIEAVQYALQAQAENAGPVEAARVREAYKALVRYMRWFRGRKFFSPPMKDPD